MDQFGQGFMNDTMKGSAAAARQEEDEAFVRDVVLPGLNVSKPELDKSKCNFKLRSGESDIHRWGVFAEEDIPSRRRVIEYTGEKIDANEVERRSARQHLYLFWTSETRAVDGAFGGSGAEFINHSCDPNLYSSVSKGHIYYVSLRKIEAGEELTVDYNLEDIDEQLPCTCGTDGCKKLINR